MVHLSSIQGRVDLFSAIVLAVPRSSVQHPLSYSQLLARLQLMKLLPCSFVSYFSDVGWEKKGSQSEIWIASQRSGNGQGGRIWVVISELHRGIDSGGRAETNKIIGNKPGFGEHLWYQF